MKRILRIPTNEQYAFVELELGDDEILTDDGIESAVDEYRRATGQIKGNAGLPAKEWNAALDEFLETNTITNGHEIYDKMGLSQQFCMQEIKKSLKRLATKNSK